MIENLLDQVAARFTELTADLLLDYKPDASKKAPDVVKTMLPYPDQDYQEAQFFPRIRLALYGGEAEDKRKPSPFTVVAVGGIWTPGDIEAGSSDIWALTEAMMRITEKRSFSPLKLRTPCPFRLGDPNQGMEGMQPHPFHFVTMRLEFINY